MYLLPKSLFARFLLITIIPVVIIQLVTAYIFYQRHWGNVSKYMQESLISELTLLTRLVENAHHKEDLEKIVQHWQVLFLVEIKDIPISSPQTKKFYVDRYQLDALKSTLEKSTAKAVQFYFIKNKKMIGCDIKFSRFDLHTEFSAKRVYSPTTHIFILWIACTSLLLVLISLLFMKNQIRSILELTNVANKFGSGQKVSSFKPSGAYEIKAAGKAFLKMKTKLERNIEYRSEMLTHISHDLRTPITRMKLRIAMLKSSDLFLALNSNLNEMEEMLGRYLQFAKGEGNEEHQLVDLTTVTRELLNNFSDTRIKLHTENQCVISVKPNAIKRMISNLVSNACKFANNHVVLHVKHLNNHILISVEDDGPGINDDLHKKVFEPFVKIDKNKDGFGLGMAIVKTIVQSHGGSIYLKRSKDHGGLMVVVNLPIV